METIQSNSSGVQNMLDNGIQEKLQQHNNAEGLQPGSDLLLEKRFQPSQFKSDLLNKTENKHSSNQNKSTAHLVKTPETELGQNLLQHEIPDEEMTTVVQQDDFYSSSNSEEDTTSESTGHAGHSQLDLGKNYTNLKLSTSVYVTATNEEVTTETFDLDYLGTSTISNNILMNSYQDHEEVDLKKYDNSQTSKNLVQPRLVDLDNSDQSTNDGYSTEKDMYQSDSTNLVSENEIISDTVMDEGNSKPVMIVNSELNRSSLGNTDKDQQSDKNNKTEANKNNLINDISNKVIDKLQNDSTSEKETVTEREKNKRFSESSNLNVHNKSKSKHLADFLIPQTEETTNSDSNDQNNLHQELLFIENEFDLDTTESYVNEGNTNHDQEQINTLQGSKEVVTEILNQDYAEENSEGDFDENMPLHHENIPEGSRKGNTCFFLQFPKFFNLFFYKWSY
jgi:hypothetical protein